MTAEELKSNCYSKEAVLCTIYPCQSLTINLSFRDQGLGFRVQGSGFNVDPVLVYPRLHRDYTRDPNITALRRRGVINHEPTLGFRRVEQYISRVHLQRCGLPEKPWPILALDFPLDLVHTPSK